MAQTPAQKAATQRYREKILKDCGNVRITLFVPKDRRDEFIRLAKEAREKNPG